MEKLKNISIATTYELDDTFDSEKFIKLRIRVCHDGENPNGSHFSLENIDKAKDSIKNIPVLGYCYFDEDNNPQFGAHEMHIEVDKIDEDKLRIIYDEVPIGVIPEICNYEVKEHKGRNYVYVDGYIWKNYSNYMQDIVERDKDVNISMEIEVDSYKYDKELGYFDITDYRYTGITMLGNDVGTGMVDAKATTTTANFEQQKEKMVILMQELKEELALYNKQNSEKGGIALAEEKKEIIEEVIKEEFETIEETEQPTVDEEVIDTPETEEVVVDEKIAEEFADKEKEPEELDKVRFSATYRQKSEALYKAIGGKCEDIYDDAGNFLKEIYYYFLDFDDEYAYVEQSIWTKDGREEKHGRFKYSFDEESAVASIDDEFEKMIVTWLTVDEHTKLQKSREMFGDMQKEYAELKEFKENTIKEQYETQVTELFDKFDKQLDGFADFEVLKVDYNNLTVNELEEKLFALLGKKNANFSTKKKETVIKVPVDINRKDDMEDPYGGLLAKKYNK